MSTDSDWVLFHICLKWSPKTTEEIARELNAIGISVDLDTVCRILKKGGMARGVSCGKWNWECARWKKKD